MSPTEKRAETIRKLLAKAESTNHPEEAKAFTAKAQSLMLKWSIDDAMLKDEPVDDIGTLDIIIDSNEYEATKVALMGIIARRNSCRIVQYPRHYVADAERKSGRRRVRRAQIIGHATDREFVEKLWTSLMVQAGSEFASDEVQERMREEMALYCDKPQQRGGFKISWHNTFNRGFNSAIDSRLYEAWREAQDEAAEQHGTECVAMVLVDKQQQVDSWMDAEFGKLRSSRNSAGSRGTQGAMNSGRQAGRKASIAGNHKAVGNSARRLSA